ncbi:MAG TPA: response regulator [Tissierellaceae bacterium]
MQNTIMLIDDDVNIIQMLKTIILKNNLGKVVSELKSGEHAVEEILFFNPDIVLIDYLLPVKDGTLIAKEAIEKGYTGKFIMISQVEDEPMISNAYNTGIMFFISKPINFIEVVNVIKNVSANIELEKSMSKIKDLLGNVNTSYIKDEVDIVARIENIFQDLGILSNSGAYDLIRIIEIVLSKKKTNTQYLLQDLYQKIADEESIISSTTISANAIEQRIRRLIQKALSNIAEIGLDDYYNLTFTEYASLLFDFKEVKQEMRFIKKESNYRGKINIRKFIEGIISRID